MLILPFSFLNAALWTNSTISSITRRLHTVLLIQKEMSLNTSIIVLYTSLYLIMIITLIIFMLSFNKKWRLVSSFLLLVVIITFQGMCARKRSGTKISTYLTICGLRSWIELHHRPLQSLHWLEIDWTWFTSSCCIIFEIRVLIQHPFTLFITLPSFTHTPWHAHCLSRKESNSS